MSVESPARQRHMGHAGERNAQIAFPASRAIYIAPKGRHTTEWRRRSDGGETEAGIEIEGPFGSAREYGW